MAIALKLIHVFTKAVLLGAIAGTAPILLLIGIMIIASLLNNPVNGGDLVAAFMIFMLPLAVAIPVITFAHLLIGAPLSRLFARAKWGRTSMYVGAGAMLGGAIPLLWSAISPMGSIELWLPLMGAVSGAVTAATWWIGIYQRRPD